MKIAVITPTRGDRPQLLAQCKKYVDRQTIQATHFVIDDPPIDPNKRDIGHRIRIGLERARDAGCHVAAIFEDDDWYSPTYLERQIGAWANAGCPRIFGVTETIFYHVGMRRWCRLLHRDRASLCGTMIRPDDVLKTGGLQWDMVFVDTMLWSRFFDPNFLAPGPAEKLFVGIKHGVGLSGSGHHRNNPNLFASEDLNGCWLRSVVGEKDFEFYDPMFRPQT